jgi:hypothetical protein
MVVIRQTSDGSNDIPNLLSIILLYKENYVYKASPLIASTAAETRADSSALAILCCPK